MNKVTLCISTLALIFSIGCSEPKESPDQSYADFKSIELVKKRAAHFKQLGRITKAVKLEITDNSFINYINKIMIDKATGDILVADLNRINRVYRFDKDGRFITYYGKRGQGPGEFNNLKNFTFCPNGDVI